MVSRRAQYQAIDTQRAWAPVIATAVVSASVGLALGLVARDFSNATSLVAPSVTTTRPVVGQLGLPTVRAATGSAPSRVVQIPRFSSQPQEHKQPVSTTFGAQSQGPNLASLLLIPVAIVGALAGAWSVSRRNNVIDFAPQATYQIECACFAVSGKKVAVLGAAGGIGQPLSLLLKDCDAVSHLALYDLAPITPGVAVDISHCNTPTKCTGHKGAEELDAALTGCDVVVIPAGVARRPGMTRDDLFNTNAGIMQNLAAACVKNCPTAVILIIANPVNSLVPICAEVFKQAGCHDPRKIIGITSLDVTRSNTWVAEIKGTDPRTENVTCIGGHAGTTILPLLSQVPGLSMDDEKLKALYNRIQFGGDEVVAAKDGGGSATLSMAYSGAEFAKKVIRALNGEKNQSVLFH